MKTSKLIKVKSPDIPKSKAESGLDPVLIKVGPKTQTVKSKKDALQSKNSLYEEYQKNIEIIGRSKVNAMNKLYK